MAAGNYLVASKQVEGLPRRLRRKPARSVSWSKRTGNDDGAEAIAVAAMIDAPARLRFCGGIFVATS